MYHTQDPQLCFSIPDLNINTCPCRHSSHLSWLVQLKKVEHHFSLSLKILTLLT